MSNLELKKFSTIDLSDPFFDTLKNDYREFESWFLRKDNELAYILYEDNLIQGFLYVKNEYGPISEIEPPINFNCVLKIGTFKIRPHGTRLGERFIKKALDIAINRKVEACYVTIFEKHDVLMALLKRYGFSNHGFKITSDGKELVLVKNLTINKNDILLDYPLINTNDVNKFLLSIYPEYHTKMFPDSILNNETVDILEDVSHTNSIHKIYVCSMPVYLAKQGDIVVIYRTSDQEGRAEYRSVATSVCVVEEVKDKSEFRDFEEFYAYANSYSIFDSRTLLSWYNKKTCYTIKMTYNAALTKRLNRKKLAEDVGLNRSDRWSFIELSDDKFYKILEMGEVHEGLIID